VVDTIVSSGGINAGFILKKKSDRSGSATHFCICFKLHSSARYPLIKSLTGGVAKNPQPLVGLSGT